MESKNAVTTIVANNYLGFALTMCDSLKDNKDLDIYILLADGLNKEINYSIYPYTFVDVKELKIDRLEEMAFKYDVVEFSTALKPFMLEYLLREQNYQKVFYVDPDICFFDSFTPVVEDLGNYSVMLTPHLTDPSIDLGNSGFEKTCLLNGIFNLGFIGFNNDSEALEILRWWKERLVEYCYNDEKYFTDQKWINLIPTLFDNINICRKKIYDYAEWNFYERDLVEDKGNYYIKQNGEFLKLNFAHVSGYKAVDPEVFLNHERIVMNESSRAAIISLYEKYREKLVSNGFRKYSEIPYCYNTYDNGIAIMELHRRLYRKMLEDKKDISHPFATDEKSLYNILKKNKLIVNEVNVRNTVFDNSQISKKSGLIKKMRQVMRGVMRVVGVKKYCMLIRFFCHYCTINDQIFLIKEYDNKE